MKLSVLSLLSSLSLLSVVTAQAPSYLSPVLLEPGNDSTKCLTASANRSGANVVIQSCNGSDGQMWSFVGGSIEAFERKCLDTGNGTRLQVLPCNGGPNQQFQYTYDYRIKWKNHNSCLTQANGGQASLQACSGQSIQVWNTGYRADALPNKSENGQSGTNRCASASSSSMCQTAWFNGVDDFCLWGPPHVGTIGDTERIEVAWCTRNTHGARPIPRGTIRGAHFVKTPDYVQITGVGDFTKMNIPKGDEGGELDPHGADGNGNPIGGLVFGNSFASGLQYHEWTSFMSDTEFCFRACVGPNAARYCQHIYDVMGCYWNMPAKYDAGTFESCEGDSTEPMGVYGTSTWHQGVKPTPPPHSPASSSNCHTIPTITPEPAKGRREVDAPLTSVDTMHLSVPT